MSTNNLLNPITPIKLGVRFDPAAIVLIYRDKSKLRSRTIPAKNVDILTDINLYVEKFKTNTKYRKYFEKISNNKLEKLIFILQDNMKGYTLKESLNRAKKYDNDNKDSNNASLNDDTDATDETNNMKKNEKIINKKSNQFDEEEEVEEKIDEEDFHDTDDEEEKNSKSVSTIEDVKAKKESQLKQQSTAITLSKPPNQSNKTTVLSKADALSFLSNQIKSIKSSIYDFEDEVEDEEIKDDNDDDAEDDNDEQENDYLKTKKFTNTKKKKEDEDKIETAQHDDLSDSSF